MGEGTLTWKCPPSSPNGAWHVLGSLAGVQAHARRCGGHPSREGAGWAEGDGPGPSGLREGCWPVAGRRGQSSERWHRRSR